MEVTNGWTSIAEALTDWVTEQDDDISFTVSGGGTSLDDIQEKFKKSQEEVPGSRLDSLTACINNERVLEKSSR